MSEESKVATETASEGTTQEATDSLPESGALVAESKKYRKRAQDAEAKLKEAMAVIEKNKEAKMIEEGKKDELIAKYKSDIESLTVDANEWNEYKSKQKAKYLEMHPEADREELSKLDFTTLKYMTDRINSAKPNVPEVAGKSRNVVPEKTYAEMTHEERKVYHRKTFGNKN